MALLEQLARSVRERQARPRRIEVTLRKGEDPHIYDADAKKDISARVVAITLHPHCIGEAFLELRDFVDGTFVVETIAVQLVYLRGDWEARS